MSSPQKMEKNVYGGCFEQIDAILRTCSYVNAWHVHCCFIPNIDGYRLDFEDFGRIFP